MKCGHNYFIGLGQDLPTINPLLRSNQNESLVLNERSGSSFKNSINKSSFSLLNSPYMDKEN